MKKLIGALFDLQENANHAYEALQKAGFASEDIHIFVHKPRQKTERATQVSIQDIAKNALLGSVVIGAIGALIGFLVGTGILPLPGFGPVEISSRFLVTSILWGVVAGGLTGIILGVAWKLLRSQEKAEVMTRQIEKRGVLITLNVDGSQSETRARRVMEENGAAEVGNPAEKWNLDGWSNVNETSPSLRNLVNTR